MSDVSDKPPEVPPGRASGRVWAMRGLATLGSIVLLLGALAVWIDRIALDSSQWSDTSVKVLQDPTVQSTVATYMVDQLYNNVDVSGAIGSFLPAAACRSPLRWRRVCGSPPRRRRSARSRPNACRTAGASPTSAPTGSCCASSTTTRARGPWCSTCGRSSCRSKGRRRSSACPVSCPHYHPMPARSRSFARTALLREGRGSRAARGRELPGDPRGADLRGRGLSRPRP